MVKQIKKNIIPVRLDDSTLKKIDKFVSDYKYDSRASFIRRATIEKLERETKILA